VMTVSWAMSNRCVMTAQGSRCVPAGTLAE
jgi:hypothetical protein